MSIYGFSSRVFLVRFLVVPCLSVILMSCTNHQYTASSPMVRVGPSKGWYKAGVDGKEAFITWQQCGADAQAQPEYLEAKKIASRVPSLGVGDVRTKEDRRRKDGPGIFIGNYVDDCMAGKGFKYMKYPAGESVYVPPRPPRKEWVNSNLGKDEASKLRRQCYQEADDMNEKYKEAWRNGTLQEHVQGVINSCMTKNGFTYKVPDE